MNHSHYSRKAAREGGGVLAHRCIWTYYAKCIKTEFKNFKKFRDKILHVHLDILCSYITFWGKRTFYVVCVKKTKNVSWIVMFEREKLSFLYGT
jgi:hypothetical protein